MVKPKTYKEITKQLKNNGFTPRQGKGDHEVWKNPTTGVSITITQTKNISPGIVRQVEIKINESQSKEKSHE